MYKTYAIGDPQAVVTDQELADWLDVDVTDVLLPVMARTATSMVIEYLEKELIDRDRVVVYERWPYSGTDATPSLSRNNIELNIYVKLPYAQFATVNSVEIFGEAYTDFRKVDSEPISLYFETIPAIGNDENPAIKAEYTAGYGATAADVPSQIKDATKMLAAYLYEHRGACDAGKALEQSGAKLALTPFKTNVVNI